MRDIFRQTCNTSPPQGVDRVDTKPLYRACNTENKRSSADKVRSYRSMMLALRALTHEGTLTTQAASKLEVDTWNEESMMDWTRLVSNLLEIMPQKLPRDCMLQGYMLHPVPITRFSFTRFCQSVGLSRNRFLIGSLTAALRFSQGLGPKRPESCDGNWV